MSFLERRARLEDLLQEDLFRAWLESKSADHIVGQSCHANDCPIATYLKSHFQTAGVDPEAIYANSASIKPPVWTARFIDKVDRFAEGTPISSAMAMNILRGVER